MLRKIVIITISFWASYGVAQDRPGGGFESYTQGLERKERAVVIGVSSYQDSLLPSLKNEAADAELMAAFLRTRSGGLLPADGIQLLTDEHATLAQFGAALAWVEEASAPGDGLVLYFMGHAKLLEHDEIAEPYILFHDSPSAPIGAGALPLSELFSTIRKICLDHSLSFRLFFDLQILPRGEAGSGPWQQWMMAFEKSFPYSATGWSRGKSNKEQTFAKLLMDGSLGLADYNSDRKVDLDESSKFLRKDSRQVPGGSAYLMAFSHENIGVAEVGPGALKADEPKKWKSTLFPSLISIEVSRLEDSLLRQSDEKTQQWYSDFILTMKLGHLMSPANRCASGLFESLLQQEQLAPLHSQWRRELAAALIDETQQALNAYLKTDPHEIFRRWRYADQYNDYPAYMARAIELLGEKNFMYPLLRTKLHYFEGLKARMDGVRGNDSLGLQKALRKQQLALQFEPEAAFVLNEMGVIYSLLNNDSAVICYRQATELSPQWGIPYLNLSAIYLNQGKLNEALDYGLTAVRLTPWNVLAWEHLGVVYLEMHRYRDAEKYLRQATALDQTYATAPYNLSCAMALQGNIESALFWLEDALNKGYDQWDHLLKDEDLAEVRKDERFESLKEKYYPGEINH